MKRIVSMFCAVALAFSSFSVCGGAINQIDNASKITETLSVAVSEADSADMLPVIIWLRDIDVENTLELAATKYIEASPEKAESYNIVNNIEKAMSLNDLPVQGENDLLEDSSRYISAKRKVFSEAYMSHNMQFADDYLEGKTVVFASKYSPMIVVELPANEIINISKQEDVVTVDLFTNAEAIACGSVSQNVTNGYYNRVTLGYTGAGVNVGVIDVGTPVLSTANTYQVSNPGLTNHVPDDVDILHTSLICEIIGGDTGYAPNCSIYTTMADDVISYFSGIEALLDNSYGATINVINISLGFSAFYYPENVSSDGQYDYIAQWTDHIVSNHNVSIVVSSGNNQFGSPNYYVLTPGMAYNAITVGCFNDNNTATTSDDVMSNISKYEQYSIVYPEKPDVVAPGVDISFGTNLVGTGTSFAAPQVTGILAQLMYANNNLKYRPSLAKSLILVSCRYAVGGGSIPSNEQVSSGIQCFSSVQGAGVVNAKIASSVLNYGQYYYSSGGTNSFPISRTVTATSSDAVIRVALSWERKSTPNSGTHDENSTFSGLNSNLNLKVITPNGVVYSNSLYNNAEVIMIQPSVYGYGTYTVTVEKVNANSQTEYVSFSWY